MAATATKHGFQLVPFSTNTESKGTSAVETSLASLTNNISIRRTSGPHTVKNVSARGWLETMRNLSPPRMRQTQTDQVEKTDCDTEDIHYRSWLLKHPSAFDKLHKITEAASAGKRIAVFLDYDGTLSPIVDDPDRAYMTEEMRNAVRGIANLFPTAIITGRSREKVFDFVRLPELYYAGSHGMDIMGPVNSPNGFKARGTITVNEKGDEVVHFQPASEYVFVMNEVYKLLEERIKKVCGARIEHNKFCISIHFRCVKEEYWLPLVEDVQDFVTSQFPKLRLTHGRKVMEIRPSISWNKGKAVDYLVKALGPESRNNIFPIYIGDDRTDEDGFKVVNRRKAGLGILVSNTVKETNAACSLRDTNEVLEFLRNIIKWKRKRVCRVA